MTLGAKVPGSEDKAAGREERFADLSCASFSERLAAHESVPSGGGATAYVGALAAALCSMVGQFTAGKKRYAAYEDDVQRMLADAELVRARLVELVDEDAKAFYPLSQAYGIPKDDPDRPAKLEQATKNALRGPVETMEQVCLAIELLEEMEQKGSRMLRSDVGCGALFARAALEAASLNVFVNTRALQDREFAATMESYCDELLSRYVPRAEAVEQRVMDGLRGRSR